MPWKKAGRISRGGWSTIIEIIGRFLGRGISFLWGGNTSAEDVISEPQLEQQAFLQLRAHCLAFK